MNTQAKAPVAYDETQLHGQIVEDLERELKQPRSAEDNLRHQRMQDALRTPKSVLVNTQTPSAPERDDADIRIALHERDIAKYERAIAERKASTKARIAQLRAEIAELNATSSRLNARDTRIMKSANAALEILSAE